jgi:hypothetical protein
VNRAPRNEANQLSDNRKPTHWPVRANELASLTAGYRRWLARQPLSLNTRRTYLGRVSGVPAASELFTTSLRLARAGRFVLDLRGFHQIMDTLISPSLLDRGREGGLNRLLPRFALRFRTFILGSAQETPVVYDLSKP